MTVREQAISDCIAALERVLVSTDHRGCSTDHRMAKAALGRLREATGAGPDLCAYQPPVYTSEPPTEPGAYWLRDSDGGRAARMRTIDRVRMPGESGEGLRVLCLSGYTTIEKFLRYYPNAEWSGPLEPPG